MHNLYKAKELLLSGGYTCVISGNKTCYTSMLRGVKPLVQWLNEEIDVNGCCAADKVIGKATAFLYVLLGVTSVYAHVISKPALHVLQQHGVHIRYSTLVENIINRKGDGICPFEATVIDINDPQTAYEAILKKMTEMEI